MCLETTYLEHMFQVNGYEFTVNCNLGDIKENSIAVVKVR